MESNVEHIIVGGGLAGLLLAWELDQRGKRFLIFSDDQPASSNVAAGTWNPVTFRRMIPTWRAQEMIDVMKEVFPKVDKALGTNLFSFIEVEKILNNDEERDFWVSMAQTDQSKDFLDHEVFETEIKGEKKTLGIVKQTGRLDLPLYVSGLRDYFSKKGNLVAETFDHSFLKFGDGVQYKSFLADNIIFAEGTYVKDNPHWNWLPFRPVKGDVLTIKSSNLNVHRIRKKNVFILPIGNDEYKIGATYHWDDQTWIPSERAKREILEKFEKISDCNYEVLDQKAGIRPATHDRRAFIGIHPTIKNNYIFNGLGSKGVFLGPLLAREFCDYLEGNAEIHPEVNIERCFQKYWKPS